MTGVALIPLTSEKDAKSAIVQAKLSLEAESREQTLEASADSDTSEDEDSHLTSPTESISPDTSAATTESSSVAEDVIGKRGLYGRFAERWFSKKGWSSEKRRTQGMSTDSLAKPGRERHPSRKAEATSAEKYATGAADVNDESSRGIETQAERLVRDEALPSSVTESITNTLLPKLLKTTRVLLASRSFFFSYDHDITRRMGSQETKSKDVPLHRSVDPIVYLHRVSCRPLIAS